VQRNAGDGGSPDRCGAERNRRTLGLAPRCSNAGAIEAAAPSGFAEGIAAHASVQVTGVLGPPESTEFVTAAVGPSIGIDDRVIAIV
jgi:hypothetical protein